MPTEYYNIIATVREVDGDGEPWGEVWEAAPGETLEDAARGVIRRWNTTLRTGVKPRRLVSWAPASAADLIRNRRL